MSTQYASYPGPQHNGGIPGHGGYPNSSLPMSNQGYNINQSNNTVPGFSFRKRMDRIDWRKIAAVDLESITRNLDFNTLQENIMNITFCNIESEVDVRSIDPNFLKLFKLAQLTIEYLLHSQDYLTGNMSVFDQRVRKVLEEHEMTQKHLEKIKQELAENKKESHKRKKMLMAQQQIIQAGTNAYNKCPYCSKAFVNVTFLQSHLARRHQENVGNYNSVLASQIQQVEPALIQSTPAPAVGSAPVKSEVNEQLQRDLLEIKERLQFTESQLVEEKNSRNSMTQKEREEQVKRDIEMTKEMNKWKDEQLVIHREEMEKMRELFMRELKEMGEKYSSAEQALYSLQKKRQSNLGDLTDDNAENQELLRQQREEVAILKEQLLEQVSHVGEEMQQKLDNQEKTWKNKFKEASREYKKDLDKLNSTIEQTHAELHTEQKGKKRLQIQYQHQLDEMNSLMKKSKETERLREQDTVIEEFTSQPSIPPQPEVVPREPVVKNTGTSNLGSQMQPDSEESDDETTSKNALDNTGRSGTGTFTGTSTGGTGTLGSFRYGTGSLSLSGTKSLRLIDEVKRNPHTLKTVKEELKGNLEAELERRGISKGAVGINGAVLQQKLGLLKKERQQTAKKHKNFFDIRQQFLNELEVLAKTKLKEQTKGRASRGAGGSRSPALVRHPGTAPPPPPPRTPPTTKRSSSASAVRSTPPPQPLVRTPQPRDLSPPPRPSTPLGGAPKPVPRPRSTSPRAKSAMSTGTITSTGRSMTFSGTGTASSSQWDDSDEEDDYPDGGPPKQLDDDDDDDWDDDDISELNAVPDPTNVARPRTVPTPSRSAATPSPKPKGEKVDALSRSIELQLMGRSDKKPVGGVNTVEMKKASRYIEEEDDDSFPTVSSEDESVSTAPPKHSVRFSDERHPIRSSQASGVTDQSNTYNTDMWGSGSRAISTAQGPNSHTTGKNTTMSSSDWDSD